MSVPTTSTRSQGPAGAALARFMDDADALGEDPVVIVEGGYFDTRFPDAPDRFEHLRDSFELVSALSKLEGVSKPTILLAALLNDFNPGLSRDQTCGAPEATCAVAPRPQRPGASAGMESLPPDVRQAYRDYLQTNGDTINEKKVEVFPMTTARNRAARQFRRHLDERTPAFFEELNSRSSRHRLFVNTGNDDVCVGTHDTATEIISVCCAGLMAQHYFDLFQWSREYERMTSLWVFDFNRYTERGRVRSGAEVSFACYDWPTDVPIRIANCVYLPERSIGEPVQITSRN